MTLAAYKGFSKARSTTAVWSPLSNGCILDAGNSTRSVPLPLYSPSPCCLSRTLHPSSLKDPGLFTKHLRQGAGPPASSIINVLATPHATICDGLWSAVRGAASKFTTAVNRDEAWGQTPGCGGGRGMQAALPPSCLSAKHGSGGQRASGVQLRASPA